MSERVTSEVNSFILSKNVVGDKNDIIRNGMVLSVFRFGRPPWWNNELDRFVISWLSASLILPSSKLFFCSIVA